MTPGYFAMAIACLAHYRIGKHWIWLAAAFANFAIGFLTMDYTKVVNNTMSIINFFVG